MVRRTREQRRFIGFLLYPFDLPHQAKAKTMASDVAFQLGSAPIWAKSEKQT